MLKSALDLRESEGKRQTNARVRSARYLCFPRGMQWNMGHSLVRMRIGGRLDCKHQTNNGQHPDQPVGISARVAAEEARCRRGSRTG